jgi:ribosome-binding protein aMBF1 (putative translation factor)
MATKVTLVRAKDVLAKHLEGPEFRARWEQSALARAVAIAVVDYRAKHGLTQTQLAHRLGVRQPHVARLETGEHTPSIEMLQRLSRVLGLRFIVEVGPAGKGASAKSLTLPRGVRVMEDVIAGGSRVRVAAG